MEYVFLFARSYEPKGAVVVVLEVIYSITDPPLKLLRRFIPPLRLGGVSLDLSFLVLFVIVTIGLQIVGPP
jgi:YggT family protein